MQAVFVSHSKRDRELVEAISSALKNVDVTPIIEEFIPSETKAPIPYEEIRSNIETCDAVFLFLTDNVMMTAHTRNWILFENGIAAALSKQLFLFERKGIPLKYPVPYLTDYMIFEGEGTADLLAIQSISKQLKNYFSVEETARHLPKPHIPYDSGNAIIWSISNLLKMRKKKTLMKNLGLRRVKCPRCSIEFYYHSPQREIFTCPACRGGRISLKSLALKPT